MDSDLKENNKSTIGQIVYLGKEQSTDIACISFNIHLQHSSPSLAALANYQNERRPLEKSSNRSLKLNRRHERNERHLTTSIPTSTTQISNNTSKFESSAKYDFYHKNYPISRQQSTDQCLSPDSARERLDELLKEINMLKKELTFNEDNTSEESLSESLTNMNNPNRLVTSKTEGSLMTIDVRIDADRLSQMQENEEMTYQKHPPVSITNIRRQSSSRMKQLKRNQLRRPRTMVEVPNLNHQTNNTVDYLRPNTSNFSAIGNCRNISIDSSHSGETNGTTSGKMTLNQSAKNYLFSKIPTDLNALKQFNSAHSSSKPSKRSKTMSHNTSVNILPNKPTNYMNEHYPNKHSAQPIKDKRNIFSLSRNRDSHQSQTSQQSNAFTYSRTFDNIENEHKRPATSPSTGDFDKKSNLKTSMTTQGLTTSPVKSNLRRLSSNPTAMKKEKEIDKHQKSSFLSKFADWRKILGNLANEREHRYTDANKGALDPVYQHLVEAQKARREAIAKQNSQDDHKSVKTSHHDNKSGGLFNSFSNMLRFHRKMDVGETFGSPSTSPLTDKKRTIRKNKPIITKQVSVENIQRTVKFPQETPTSICSKNMMGDPFIRRYGSTNTPVLKRRQSKVNTKLKKASERKSFLKRNTMQPLLIKTKHSHPSTTTPTNTSSTITSTSITHPVTNRNKATTKTNGSSLSTFSKKFKKS
ncbi:hypothetical protein SNEBB_004101 [Seison nebaliae]|nr:hypothetical protein SNEBB_004101 [Seison nebaliae]